MSAIRGLTCDNKIGPGGVGSTSRGLTHLSDRGGRGLGVSLPIEEQWRPIPGWEGVYEASDQGRVRVLPRNGRPRKVLKTRPNPVNRYEEIGLYVNGSRRTNAKAHILVLQAFVGPRPSPSHHACHNNGDPSDNRLSNLRWDTARANQMDRVRHGRNHWTLRTHCAHGHEFTPENTVKDREGHRRCRECHRAAGRARYAARKQEADAQRIRQVAQ